MDDFTRLEKEILELKTLNKDLKDRYDWHISNIYANILFPIVMYLFYIFLKEFFVDSAIFNSGYISVNSSILIFSFIVSLLIFIKPMITNSKLILKYVFSKYFL